MRLYVLDNGYLSVPRSKMLKAGGDEKIKMPITLFLMETGQGWVLFDTGCHPDAMRGYWHEALAEEWPYCYTEEQRLENQLALCGITPADVKTVVLSHFHMDHTGNLYLFPHADVYAPKEDFLFGLGRVHGAADRNAHGGYIREDMDVPVKQYHLVEQDMPLLPGIDLVTLPGHAPGLLGMVVHLDSETLILPQDCVYGAEIYGPPAAMCGSAYDEDKFYRSIEKVRALEQAHHARVLFGHDEILFQSLKHAPDCYE